MSLEWVPIKWGMFGNAWTAYPGNGVTYTVETHHQVRFGGVTLSIKVCDAEVVERKDYPDVETAKKVAEFYAAAGMIKP
jgi:hypothetical protein